MNALRKFKSEQIEFPLTLGRDFVGEVIHKGMAVRNGIQLCDKVWGAIPVHMNGSLAEYVAVDANFVCCLYAKGNVEYCVDYAFVEDIV